MKRMESAAERVRRLRLEQGIDSAAELARLANMPEATLRAYESNRRPLTPRAARALARPLGVTWQALLFDPDGPEAAGAAATLEQASAQLGQRISRRTRLGAEIVMMAGDAWVLVPVHDARAAAGPARNAAQNTVLHRIAFREDWIASVTSAPISQLGAITVAGDSMEPTLRQGDLVLVDSSQNRPQQQDGVYVIRTEGGLQVKRLQAEVSGGLVTMLSDNKAYEPQRHLKPEDVHVLGRVIWLGRHSGL
jgi:phage repressor protein C with HTH and peptisase S24 domain